MFEQLIQGLMNVNRPSFQGFLADLWSIWAKDVGRAVLLARWSWDRLPEDLAQQANTLQRQAQAAHESAQIDQQVNAALGSMGIFSGSSGGGGFGFGMDPDQSMFIMYMGMIRAHRGDPPVSPGMVQFAEPVLTGQMDPIQALVASAPPYTQQQLVTAAQMMAMMGMDQFLRVQAVVQAAFSLPRDRISVLLPELS